MSVAYKIHLYVTALPVLRSLAKALQTGITIFLFNYTTCYTQSLQIIE